MKTFKTLALAKKEILKSANEYIANSEYYSGKVEKISARKDCEYGGKVHYDVNVGPERGSITTFTGSAWIEKDIETGEFTTTSSSWTSWK